MANRYKSRILHINLNSGEANTEVIDESTTRMFLGGKGLGSFILYRELGKYGKSIDPFNPDNLIIISAGPLTGNWLPGSAKYAIVTKSPLTGTFLDTLAGGFFGAEVRLAGYDAIAIKGRTDRLSYLFIDDHRVELRNASSLKGMFCNETQDAIIDEIGDPDVRIASIGPAGENLVKFACITIDYNRHTGRGGAGAVMGSKNLKAIAVRGSCGIKIYDIAAYKKVAMEAYAAVRSSPGYEALCTTGTTTGIGTYSEVGTFPTRNHYTGVFEGSQKINEGVLKYIKTHQSCYACNERCGIYRVIDEGRYISQGIGPEYETIALLGSNCGIDSIEAISKANALTSEYGIDTISTGSVVAFAMECFERGIIGTKETGGIDLRFGNADALIDIIHLIAQRKGIGQLLAEGTKRFSEHLGPETEPFAMHVKGLDLPGYEVRSLWALALGYATSDRGACHMRASTADDEIAGKWGDRLSPETYADGKGLVIKQRQDEMAWKNSICICKFIALTSQHIVNVLSALTGWDFTVEELEMVGERVYNLTRCFNVREGFTRRDDTLPARCFNEPLPDGPPKGLKLEHQQFEKMLDGYYDVRGWDRNGVPKKNTLERLSLKNLLINFR